MPGGRHHGANACGAGGGDARGGSGGGDARGGSRAAGAWCGLV